MTKCWGRPRAGCGAVGFRAPGSGTHRWLYNNISANGNENGTFASSKTRNVDRELLIWRLSFAFTLFCGVFVGSIVGCLVCGMFLIADSLENSPKISILGQVPKLEKVEVEK